jgi:hypothetical protein
MGSFLIRRYVCIAELSIGFSSVVLSLLFLLFELTDSLQQVHMTSELHNQWTRNSGPNKGPSDPDGASIFEIETLEQFLPAIGDPYYNDIILKHDLQCDDFDETTIPMGTVGWKKDIIVSGMARVDTSESERLLREMNEGRPDSP